MMKTPGEITRYLSLARGGDRRALDEVFARVYQEIHRIAHRQVRRAGPAPTLNTTVVVNEAYLRLVRSPAVDWEDRSHFYAVAALAMRQILLNHARRRLARKRGGERPLSLEEDDAPVAARAAEFVDLDAALQRLAALDSRLARVVDLRFFAGLSVEETARMLGVTDRTVKRDWQAARAYLFRELSRAART